VTAQAADREVSDSARFAFARERLAEADAARMAELDRMLRENPERDPDDDLCPKGHPLDGVRAGKGGGKPYRYCLRCHREKERLRARNRSRSQSTAGLATAFEGA
jgi:hypothetical protein